MNEVEKMYENAGISTISQKTKDCDYCYYYEETYDAPCYVCTADKCPFEKNIIPPFTAEKQLKLIKWLIIEGYIEDMLTVQISEENFEACLADTFNELWQDLTEEERKQIKEILSE